MRSLVLVSFLICSICCYCQNEVLYMWSGAITYNSAKVNAKLTDTSSTIRLVVDDDSTFVSPIYSGFYSADTTHNNMVAMQISGLNANTKYFYCVESAGIMDSSADDIGSFKTHINGPFSYSFVAGSCCLNSNHVVYSTMENMHPLFYINMGDLHYADPNSATNINIHRLPYENEVLSKQRAAKFFKSVPITHIWDDHDFSGNDSDSSALGKKNARLAYQEYVPHYPLAFGSGNNIIAQAFTVGRVHFILTDLRSDRYSSSMLGNSQKQWFKNQCIYARNNNYIIAWISTDTWNGSLPDNWGGYQAERQELANFFRDSLIANLFILAGDAHMLAADDGTNTDFCTVTSNPFRYPIFQAAAINQNGSIKGGIFNQGGPFPNPDYTYGQFGLITVTDSGADNICITFEGYNVDSSGQNVQQLISYSFCRLLPPTSLPEKDISDLITIVPNPASTLNIEFKSVFRLKSVCVYSLNGGIVFTEKLNNNPYLKYSKTLPQLENGCYIVKIETFIGTVKKYWVKI